MKLRNKLIPLMTAATVAATVAPVTLTSCGANNLVNLINGYKPSIAKATWENNRANKDDMLAFYMSAVNENKEIFAQDLYWKYATEALYDNDGVSKINKLEAKASNIDVKKLTCFYEDTAGVKQSVDYYCVSMDFVFNSVTEEVDGYDSAKDEYTTSITISAKNIPCTINKPGTSTDLFPGEPEESPKRKIEYIIQFLDSCFIFHHLPTDWLIQPLVSIVYAQDFSSVKLDYEPFTLLEANGYDWSVKVNISETEVSTSLIDSQTSTESSTLNAEMKEVAQFAKAEEALKEYFEDILWYLEDPETREFPDAPASLELMMAQKMHEWYLPTYYLSDIMDVNHQIWPIA